MLIGRVFFHFFILVSGIANVFILALLNISSIRLLKLHYMREFFSLAGYINAPFKFHKTVAFRSKTV